MTHHCREHWASQHSWQTMPAEAAGQRSAGSGTCPPQSAQKGMVVGSSISEHQQSSKCLQAHRPQPAREPRARIRRTGGRLDRAIARLRLGL